MFKIINNNNNTKSGGRFGINFDDDDDDDDELMLVDDEKAFVDTSSSSRNMMQEEEEESAFDYKKFLKESDTSLTSNYSNLPKSFKQSIMHDYIGHTIQNIVVLFHSNFIPSFANINNSSSSSEGFSELILAISVRNTVRFYTLLNDGNKQMKIIEFSEKTNSNPITLENNIKFIKVIDDMLIVCDDKGTIHVYKHKAIRTSPPPLSTTTSSLGVVESSKLTPHELEITCPYRPFQMCPNSNSNSDQGNINFLSFDAEALVVEQDSGSTSGGSAEEEQGDVLKIAIALGTSNGVIYYSIFSNSSRKRSQFAALRQVKYQHKSMLPILGLTLPIKKMVTIDIPIMLYYRTMNCVFSIDVNDSTIVGTTTTTIQSKYEPSLILKTKDRITCMNVHPLQPNNIIVGLAKGTLIGRDQVGVWDRSISTNAIKAITFGYQSKSILVGDEQGFIYSVDLTSCNQKSSQTSEVNEQICLENLDGNDILHIEYLSSDEMILAVNSNGRINLVLQN